MLPESHVPLALQVAMMNLDAPARLFPVYFPH
jgi:hypothetical protein